MRLSTLSAATAAAASLSLAAATPIVDSPFIAPFALAAESSGNGSAPVSTGGAWKEGFARARALVDQMTLEEAANVTVGYTGNCVGYTGEVSRLGLKPICLQDGPEGVRPARRVSQFPSGVTVAATWSRDLIAKRADAMANEFKDKGVQIWLGPVTGGPIGRSPLMGRNWEGFAADEYLTGEASYISVKTAQSTGLMACAKHYILYEQETYRNPYNSSEPGYAVFPPLEQQPISSNVDDVTTHELYMWSFAEAVRAGTATIMCSYNRVNQTHACGDDYSQNVLLKGELGFQGAIISDWSATFSNDDFGNGLDVTMPGSAYGGTAGNFGGQALVDAVKAGSVSEERLRDATVRILAPYYHFGLDEGWPEVSFDVRDLSLPTKNVRKSSTPDLIKRIGVESFTLLKNNRTDGHGLPLKARSELQSLLVAGQGAGDNINGQTSCGQTGVCPTDGFNGVITTGGGSGWAFPPYVRTPLSILQDEARSSGFDINAALDNWNTAVAIQQAKASEACLVFVNAFATEGRDRANLTAEANADQLVRDVAANCNNTVVIVNAPGPILMPWADEVNVTAVAYAYLPGQEGGASLPPLLWGDESPSGKLPFTIGRDIADWPPNGIFTDKVKDPSVNFTEGRLIDYKWFDSRNVTPQFAFGHGLSYSEFEFGELAVEKTFQVDSTSIQPTNEAFDASKGPEQSGSVYDVIAKATVSIKNSGKVKAAEVAQLYVSFPESSGAPPKLLRGFSKLHFSPGESRTAMFPLRRKDLSQWSVEKQRWELPSGPISLRVGPASDKLGDAVTLEW